MIKLAVALLIPYLAVASVATGAVDGHAALDAAGDFIGEVRDQTDEVATQIIYGPPDLDHHVTVCHVPDGEASKARLLSVAMDAKSDHMEHGDYSLTATELLVEPLLSLCGTGTPAVAEHSSSSGNAPEHSNAGEGGPPEHSNADAGNPPEHSNADGNKRAGGEAD